MKLETDSGETVELKSFRGKKVVLYFYPKADTPGCTKESCDFRDHHAEFDGKNTVVLGISPDKPAKQAKFKDKYELSFPLLGDVDKKAAEAYGVWKEKSMYGRKYMGIERTTFLIDEKGKIAKIYAKVKVAGHAADVLSAV
ncbi:MAG: thioredoxin-dependent thiol peroxidase [bacterium]|nr:thioredoxin-dependent thiol peroxidase [bacterium]